mmetsp:Transcript_26922/g.74006  ORF Transcript_26922/g.74006 Transcript_26922/m.74006 type:complete len:726 (+) Transcript_26922:56-2233(+)
MEDEPTIKRAKLGDDNDDRYVEELVQTAWEHYRNYLDSIGGEEEGMGGQEGEIDELQELIEISKGSIQKPSIPYARTGNEIGIDSIEVKCPEWESREKMLPVLLSVAYNHLADDAISQYLMIQQEQLPSANKSQVDGSLNVATAIENATNLLIQSLEWYPFNSSTWSMGANFGRISQLLSPQSSRNWYEMAVKSSIVLRKRALDAVEDKCIADEEKEWIELLVLNQIVGVEYETEDDDDSREGEDTKSNQEYESGQYETDDKGAGKIDETEDMESDPGWYSSSSVEATSRFMCAMLWSMDGRHDRALVHLKPFGLTHRLHPNVWRTDPSTPVAVVPTKPPVVFQPPGGIIPPHLYDTVTKLFAPSAAYWKESNYSSRGYYSFFHEYDRANRQQPRNLIEEVVVNHLMPRAQQCLDNMEGGDDDELDSNESTKICGFEWWVHTRPIKANLGHNLHFDTDESMLDQEGKVTHPVLSSVLYLTGGQNGDLEANTMSSSPAGATIILDETPDSTSVGEYCWQGIPKDNTFLVFPGDRLHGVLPCPGSLAREGGGSDDNASLMEMKTLIHDLKDHKGGESDGGSLPSSSESPPNRLTFMVGFWTRNVPATMKHRSLYGPCGPLPPATEEHTWVRDIMVGYNSETKEERPVADKVMTATALPRVSPAWEVITNQEDRSYDNEEEYIQQAPPPVIPYGIDHRFFVRNAPVCFRESLFEDREVQQKISTEEEK